jgi:hypothetical protein
LFRNRRSRPQTMLKIHRFHPRERGTLAARSDHELRGSTTKILPCPAKVFGQSCVELEGRKTRLGLITLIGKSMSARVEDVSKYRLRGEPCPKDLEILIRRGASLLEEMGIEIGGDPTWAPWADKSYLTEADYRDPDIAANVKALDDTFAFVRFVARTDQGECIGYWCGPENRAVGDSPVVYYDTEGQFRLCGTRFVEALFFVMYGDDMLNRVRTVCSDLGIPLGFDSIDDIVIPEGIVSPESYHQERYQKHKHA